MQRGCPLNEEGETCHVMLEKLFTRTEHAFKEIGGMCLGLHYVQHYDQIISVNGILLLIEL